jgi:hypothetical protein
MLSDILSSFDFEEGQPDGLGRRKAMGIPRLSPGSLFLPKISIKQLILCGMEEN